MEVDDVEDVSVYGRTTLKTDEYFNATTVWRAMVWLFLLLLVRLVFGGIAAHTSKANSIHEPATNLDINISPSSRGGDGRRGKY